MFMKFTKAASHDGNRVTVNGQINCAGMNPDDRIILHVAVGLVGQFDNKLDRAASSWKSTGLQGEPIQVVAKIVRGGKSLTIKGWPADLPGPEVGHPVAYRIMKIDRVKAAKPAK